MAATPGEPKWARLHADVKHGLRRGAWYRVIRLTEDDIVLREPDHSVPRSSTEPVLHVGVQARPLGLTGRRCHPQTTCRLIGETIFGTGRAPSSIATPPQPSIGSHDTF